MELSPSRLQPKNGPPWRSETCEHCHRKSQKTTQKKNCALASTALSRPYSSFLFSRSASIQPLVLGSGFCMNEKKTKKKWQPHSSLFRIGECNGVICLLCQVSASFPLSLAPLFPLFFSLGLHRLWWLWWAFSGNIRRLRRGGQWCYTMRTSATSFANFPLFMDRNLGMVMGSVSLFSVVVVVL